MVVQHNMQASNASRMLNITAGNQSKSTEKLASGYKINRAADDAAGLSISEKMRKQIRGLDQASTNAQDGVSAVQSLIVLQSRTKLISLQQKSIVLLRQQNSMRHTYLRVLTEQRRAT